MGADTGTALGSAIGIGAGCLFHWIAPPEMTRVGLMAAAAAGIVFGATVPVEAVLGQRVRRAIRTAAAFAVTTGIGYGFYQGPPVGMAWGIGGLIGCFAGVMTAQLGRRLVVKEESE